ncbi:putative DNA RNA non specific endonuclease [Trypanosoma vivax]|nr:putative DNA RNA non specific endonuclease [Trypanosoma vivax]
MTVRASSVGRAFALLSSTLFGGAVGVLIERARREAPPREVRAPQDPPPQVPGGGGGGADRGGLESPLALKLASKGLPSDERVRCYGGFIASLNYERRVPNWVLEYLPGSGPAAEAPSGSDDALAPPVAEGGRREGMRFFADAAVPEAFRVLPNDYGSGTAHQRHARGLSRGHLAAAQFHKGSSEEMAQTFNMNANVVPQDMAMNAVDWLRLENLTRRLQRQYERGLWVVTGPVFHPRMVHGDARAWGWSRPPSATAALRPAQGDTLRADGARKVVCYELVGKHDVAVPTHLFKVVLGERADGTHEAAAFLMPNEPIAVERPLASYLVPVGDVERLTGLEFFRNVGVDAEHGGGTRLLMRCMSHRVRSD